MNQGALNCVTPLKIPGGGEVLSIFADGDVPFFRVSFSPIFSRTGYQKKANFLELVVKTCEKRRFCYNGLLLSQIFVFLSILLQIFSRTGYHLKAKILEQGEQFFFRGHIPGYICHVLLYFT